MFLNIKGKIGGDKFLFPVIELVNQTSSVIKLDTQSQPQFVPLLGKYVSAHVIPSADFQQSLVYCR